MSIPKDEFLKLLRKSQVIAPRELGDWLENNECDDAKKLAIRLIDSGLLTNWQAKYLLSGKSRLWFGSYVLLERLSREEIGDRFVGIHRQLNRKVDILFLSPEFSKKSMRLTELIRQVGEAADIDHPNLEHVYDIDQVDNRYYLVTEFITGRPLDEIHRARQLTSVQLATIIRQTVDAVNYAHQHGVTHGGLIESDMIIDAGNQLKIRNMVLAFLTRFINRNGNLPSTAPNEDWRAVSRIAGNLLEDLPLKYAVGDCQILSGLFLAIGGDGFEAASISRALDDWVAEYDLVPPAHFASGTRAVETAIPPPDPIAETRSETKPVASQEKPGTRSITEKPVPAGSNSVIRYLVAAMCVTFLLIGGILSVAGIFDGSDKKSANVAESWDAPKPPPDLRPALQAPNRKPAGIGDQTIATGTEFDATTPDLDREPASPTANELRERDQDSTDNDPLPTKPLSAETESTIATPEDRVTQVSETGDRQTADLLNGKPAGDDSNSAAATEKPIEKDPNAVAETSSPTTNDKLPFHDLADAVDIPPASDPTETTLGSVYRAGNHLLLAELVWDEQLARGRVNFELQRTDTDKLRWNVLFKKRPDEEGAVVAQFALSGTQLLFTWQPGAAENEYSDYLRNAMLTLKYPGHQRMLKLRKPFLVEGFKLSAENPQVESEVPVSWLPKNVLATVNLHQDNYGILYFEPESATFDRRRDLRIFFDIVDHDQMVSLLLESDIRKNIRLSAQLQLHLARQNRPEVATPKRMDEARSMLQQYVELKTTEYTAFDKMSTDQVREYFRNKDITYDQKLEFVKQRKEDMELAKNRHAIFDSYSERLSKFLDQPLPVVVYYELAGVRVVIATTTQLDPVEGFTAIPAK